MSADNDIYFPFGPVPCEAVKADIAWRDWTLFSDGYPHVEWWIDWCEYSLISGLCSEDNPDRLVVGKTVCSTGISFSVYLAFQHKEMIDLLECLVRGWFSRTGSCIEIVGEPFEAEKIRPEHGVVRVAGHRGPIPVVIPALCSKEACSIVDNARVLAAAFAIVERIAREAHAEAIAEAQIPPPGWDGSKAASDDDPLPF